MEKNNNNFKPSTAFEGWLYSEINNLKKDFENHLKHHWAVELALLVLVAGLVVELIVK